MQLPCLQIAGASIISASKNHPFPEICLRTLQFSWKILVTYNATDLGYTVGLIACAGLSGFNGMSAIGTRSRFHLSLERAKGSGSALGTRGSVKGPRECLRPNMLTQMRGAYCFISSNFQGGLEATMGLSVEQWAREPGVG